MQISSFFFIEKQVLPVKRNDAVNDVKIAMLEFKKKSLQRGTTTDVILLAYFYHRQFFFLPVLESIEKFVKHRLSLVAKSCRISNTTPASRDEALFRCLMFTMTKESAK